MTNKATVDKQRGNRAISIEPSKEAGKGFPQPNGIAPLLTSTAAKSFFLSLK